MVVLNVVLEELYMLVEGVLDPGHVVGIDLEDLFYVVHRRGHILLDNQDLLLDTAVLVGDDLVEVAMLLIHVLFQSAHPLEGPGNVRCDLIIPQVKGIKLLDDTQ